VSSWGLSSLELSSSSPTFQQKGKITLAKKERPRLKLNKVRVTSTTLLGAAGVFLGARFAVGSATAVAQILQVPFVTVGAKIVAIGTSLPELVVDSTAVRKGHYEMALGDLIGSNLVNITLIFGSLLIASRLAVNLAAFSMEVTFVLIAGMTLWYFLSKGRFTQHEGIILVLIYVLFQAILR